MIRSETRTGRRLVRTRRTPAIVALGLLLLVGALPALAGPARHAVHGAAAAAERSQAFVLDEHIRAIVARVDRERVIAETRALSGETPLCIGADCATIADRVTGRAGVDRAQDYIAAHARSLGYDVEEHGWFRSGLVARNILASRTGVVSPTERVYYVAHVDAVGSCSGGRCPGADDNASGTVAGLELMRLLADVPLERTLVLMFSTGEEQGMYGVVEYLQDVPRATLGEIRMLLNADMIGYDGNEDDVMEIYHGDHGPSIALADTMHAIVRAYTPELQPRINPGCG